MQTARAARPAPAFDLADLFTLNVKPAPRPVRGRAMQAIDLLDDLGIDLFDLDPTPTGEPVGFGPAARDFIHF